MVRRKTHVSQSFREIKGVDNMRNGIEAIFCMLMAVVICLLAILHTVCDNTWLVAIGSAGAFVFVTIGGYKLDSLILESRR